MIAEQPTHSSHVASTCTSLNLRKAARAASHFLEGYLLPVGLHASQFGILNQLSKNGTIPMTCLADILSIDRTTLTRNLQIMQRDGLVDVALCGKDKRVRQVCMTDKGKDVFAKALPLWEQAEAALTERLGADNRQSLLSLTSAIVAIAEK